MPEPQSVQTESKFHARGAIAEDKRMPVWAVRSVLTKSDAYIIRPSQESQISANLSTDSTCIQHTGNNENIGSGTYLGFWQARTTHARTRSTS